MTAKTIISTLGSMGNPEDAAGKARFGIKNALGIRIPALVGLAKKIGPDHDLALELWTSGISEAMILAVMLADPARVTQETAEAWVADFNSWDVCDQCCNRLLVFTPFAWEKAREWANRTPEFEKRAGFVLMAQLAVKDKAAPDKRFTAFFPLIRQGAQDDRNYVKKAVSWALRQMGKRSATLHPKALDLARRLSQQPDAPSRWVGKDAFKELSGPAVQKRLGLFGSDRKPPEP